MAVVVTCKSGDDLEYVWTNQGAGGPAQADSGYYIDAPDAEAPGRWWLGPGAGEALGLETGQRVEKSAYLAVYKQVNPTTGEKMGSSPGNFAKFEDTLARKLAAEPHATEARKQELRAEAHKETRVGYPYTDITVSFSKDISVLGASIRENLRQAREAGDSAGQAYWADCLARFQECLQEGNRAALEYLQTWAGITRTGHHGTRVDGQEPGRYEDAGLVFSSWLQGTSRAGDPQEHIHNQLARLVFTLTDREWRAKYGMAVRAALPGMAAVAAVRAEAALARVFGVTFRARADGRGMRIAGTPQWLEELFSSRTVSIEDAMPEAIAAWSRRHDGTQPNEAQVFAIRQQVTLLSRETKKDGAIDWDAHAQEWDARSSGALAQFPAQVSNMRGPDGGAGAARNTRNPGGPPERSALAQAARDALETVQRQKSAWTRAELLKAVAVTMPPETRQMDPSAAVRMLERIADDILASRHGDVVTLESHEFLSFPESMRRGPDRRTVYERPGAARYATSAHLDAEHSLVSNAQRLGGWRMEPERAATLLGSTVPALEDALLTRSAEAGQARTRTGLRMDQAAALFHALTNARTATVLTGPAGSGKSHSLGAAASAAVDAGATEVWGVAASQQAANVLAEAGRTAGVEIKAFNSHQFLGLTPGQEAETGTPKDVRPGSVILIDEGSMLGLDHMLAVLRKANAVGAKVIIAGDQEQLAAVTLGGAMKLLSQRLGFVKLAEPVRFESAWERDATLRLRAGDDTVLEEYDQQGRFRAGTADRMMDAAAKAYVANALDGVHTRLIAQSWDRCRELSRRVRDDLKHLGIVQDGPVVELAEGAQASVGDLVVSRKVDHDAGLANGDVLRVESVEGGRAVLRKVVDRDKESGGAVLAEHTITYGEFSEFNLAYAVTGHAAQGDTVTEGLAYVTGSEPRNWMYVAMSRGARTNQAFVVTRPETADLRGAVAAPELARQKRLERERAGKIPGKVKASESDRDHLAVLADVLSRDGGEDSASEILRRNLANADHLGILHTYWQQETIATRKTVYIALARELLPGQYQDAASAPTSEWLYRSLRQAEICGLDPRQLLDRAVSAGGLSSARDVASVLNHRIGGYIAGMAPARRKWADQVPVVSDPELQQFLGELAEAMDGRAERLGEFAAETAPGFLTEVLGPVPDAPSERLDWQHKASAVMAYREVYNFGREDDAIGAEPSMASPEKHALWQAAYEATGSPGAENLSEVSDAQLRIRAAMYQRETSWAPRYAANELREARVAMHDAEAGMTRAAAEATAARERGQQEQAAQHDRLRESYHALADRYRTAKPVLVAAVEDYDNWLAVTETSRRMAVAADAELRRRYPDDKLPPLRSAEPEPVTESEHDELATQDAQPEWLQRMARESAAFREAQAEREAQAVPHEDHELGDESLAWRTDMDRERDAVIQPAPVEIAPSEQVIKAREADIQAGH